ncbi:hypothetical protein JCM5353_005179 [Sporobolomyces roseus]
MSLKALWKSIDTPDNLARSSHGLAVVQEKLYIFGGELKPRTPVEGDVTVLDLTSSESSTLKSSSASSWPASRVGASFTSYRDKIYLWGGRGGTDMGTFSGENGIWKFDVATKEWRELETKGEHPEPRSFHTMCALDNKLYLHAGCPASGRLAQLHSIDLSTLEWTALPSAPEPGRGGTVLTALPASTASSPLLARFGGFAGYELDGLDLYDIGKKEWRSVQVSVEGGGEGPEKRSVHVLTGLDGELEWEEKRVVAVMALGEREGAPAELGHAGAGFFHNDAWALLATKESDPSFSWIRLESSEQSTHLPEARGWLPASHVSGSKVVFQGGLNEKNERLGDAWTLEVVKE